MGWPSSSANRPTVAPLGETVIELWVMNFGNPQIERPASSVKAWFTGSWRMKRAHPLAQLRGRSASTNSL